MGFSAITCPDIITISYMDLHPNGRSRAIESIPCKLNLLGYIPVVSTISGLSRVLLGIAYTINELVRSIFDENHLLQGAGIALGLKNIGRGLVEMMPFVGNVSMILLDKNKVDRYQSVIHEQLQNPTYADHAVVFGNDRFIAKCPYAAYDAALAQLGREPTCADRERIIRNHRG